MKVDYMTLSGPSSTAYLDDDEITGDVMTGNDRYTEARIVVVWDGSVWREVAR